MIEFSVTIHHERAPFYPFPPMHSTANFVGTPNAGSERLIEDELELRLVTMPDEDPKTNRSDVRLHGK